MLPHMFLYPLQAVLTTIFLCVSVVIVCDGAAYENSFCSQKRCPTPGYFRCKETRRCVTQSSVCNRHDNCGDGSDEENCGPVYLDCIDGHGFHCDGGSRCIRYLYVCDGSNHCSDGSDEQNCLTRRCPYDDDFKCNDTGICIRGYDRCDGYSECQRRYGSASDYDEQNCDVVPCPYDGDHRCGDGRCVRSRYICDGSNNCGDGSDEANCYGMQSCPYGGDFRCSSGACIRSYEVCDGGCTCQDCSDEDNCSSLSCPSSSYYIWCPRYNSCYFYIFYSCYDFMECGYNNNSYFRCYDCGNATIISYRYVFECDGIEDCSDGNDELNCFERPCFAVDDFRCTTTGACIRSFQVCDGMVHCSDGSDEENCLSRNCTISGDVHCKDNGKCIHSDMVCNGVNDCMDGSDETNCDDMPCPYDDDFRCAINGACVRADDVCNGNEDCLDGSDEGLNYCPEDTTMGVVWERSLTNTTHKHQCSSIHPSFKLPDMVTRQCMKNRSWAPVDVSQCVMDVGSPVVMILVITLDTENTTKVQAEMDQIVQEINEAVIDSTSVQFVMLDTFENISLKITYEFSTFTTEQLVELINYEGRLATLGSFSVSAGPQLTVFESTSICKCPNSVESSSINLISVNSTEKLNIFSVCTGKPCQCSTSTTCQCVAPFAGNGVVCGRDSDGDGYADMKLDCDDSQCEQDICSTIYNPEQTNASCGISTVTVESGSSSSDDSLSTGAAIGITFVMTLLLSVAFTLLVVYIVYKIRTRKEQTASEEEVPTSAKPIVTAKDSDVYEYPENIQSPRYQGDPLATIQPNPSYDMHYFDTTKDKPVYANVK